MSVRAINGKSIVGIKTKLVTTDKLNFNFIYNHTKCQSATILLNSKKQDCNERWKTIKSVRTKNMFALPTYIKSESPMNFRNTVNYGIERKCKCNHYKSSQNLQTMIHF